MEKIDILGIILIAVAAFALGIGAGYNMHEDCVPTVCEKCVEPVAVQCAPCVCAAQPINMNVVDQGYIDEQDDVCFNEEKYTSICKVIRGNRIEQKVCQQGYYGKAFADGCVCIKRECNDKTRWK